MSERSTQPNIALVSLFAGLAGAVVALLVAPRSGKETREGIRLNAEDMKQQAQQTLGESRNQVERAVKQAKTVREKVTNKMKHQGKDMEQKTTETVQDAQLAPDHIQSPVLSKWEKEI